MKAFTFALLIIAGAAPAFAVVPVPTTLAQWTFETSMPVTAGPFAPEIGAGSASGYHAGASTYSSPAGNGSAHSFSSNSWAVGDYYQFNVSTVGFSGIAVSFDQTSSGTGPRNFSFQYSTDGEAFTSFSDYSVLANATPNTPWTSTTGVPNPAYNFSYDFSCITELNDQANVYFRLIDNSVVSANGGVVGTGGTDRVDNFTVTVIPEPSTYAALVGALALGYAGWCRRRRA